MLEINKSPWFDSVLCKTPIEWQLRKIPIVRQQKDWVGEWVGLENSQFCWRSVQYLCWVGSKKVKNVLMVPNSLLVQILRGSCRVLHLSSRLTAADAARPVRWYIVLTSRWHHNLGTGLPEWFFFGRDNFTMWRAWSAPPTHTQCYVLRLRWRFEI